MKQSRNVLSNVRMKVYFRAQNDEEISHPCVNRNGEFYFILEGRC